VTVGDAGHIVGGIMPSEFAFPDDEVGVWLPSSVMVPA
jgi:hypothetical protein